LGWISGGTVEGWASLSAIVLILGSVQLLVLGVFGEYLGRMYMEAKRRPLFIIDEIRSHARSSKGANPVHEMEAELEKAFNRAAG